MTRDGAGPGATCGSIRLKVELAAIDVRPRLPAALFPTDLPKMESVLQDGYIFIQDKKISSLEHLLRSLRKWRS
jgi:hypothetical protein